jgi:hypothetical protein
VAYGVLGVAAYTYEMGSEFFQSCASFESTIYPDNLDALLDAFKAARRPYMNPSGPDSRNVTAIPGVVIPGDAVQLTALATDDIYYNGNGTEPTQNVTAARYSIDELSWQPGAVTYPMTASDGTFNEHTEANQAT